MGCGVSASVGITRVHSRHGGAILGGLAAGHGSNNSECVGWCKCTRGGGCINQKSRQKSSRNLAHYCNNPHSPTQFQPIITWSVKIYLADFRNMRKDINNSNGNLSYTFLFIIKWRTLLWKHMRLNKYHYNPRTIYRTSNDLQTIHWDLLNLFVLWWAANANSKGESNKWRKQLVVGGINSDRGGCWAGISGWRRVVTSPSLFALSPPAFHLRFLSSRRALLFLLSSFDSPPRAVVTVCQVSWFLGLRWRAVVV